MEQAALARQARLRAAAEAKRKTGISVLDVKPLPEEKPNFALEKDLKDEEVYADEEERAQLQLNTIEAQARAILAASYSRKSGKHTSLMSFFDSDFKENGTNNSEEAKLDLKDLAPKDVVADLKLMMKPDQDSLDALTQEAIRNLAEQLHQNNAHQE